MRDTSLTVPKSKQLLQVQGRLIKGYIASLVVMCVAISFMPTKVLIWNLNSGRIYVHSILFWISLFSAYICFRQFKKGNLAFKESFPGKLPRKSFSLYRTPASKLFAIITSACFFLLLIVAWFPVSTYVLFILFAICILFLGLYLGLNSYEFSIYCKHRKYILGLSPKKSQIRRDDNVENHQS